MLGRRKAAELPTTCRNYNEDATRQMLGETEGQRMGRLFACRLNSIDHNDDAGLAPNTTYLRVRVHHGHGRAAVTAGQAMNFPEAGSERAN